ncbi:hypothetical protein PMAYCL1PPCAC_30518 [Pristionchus mayeri]|uniref:Uncharacterized protein n=1 Tax=Pristionchus mayeri TaxID=1317129 RepID=A0AAN5DBZ1_9BILA|nr:hypothetical protein PMAYCL1PPCAC_30518 [Pristionchus mayeri]
MEAKLTVLSRLLEEVESRNDRLADYKPLWDAMKGNQDLLDREQRAWYDAQIRAYNQFITSVLRLREIASKGDDCCTKEGDLQLAAECAANAHAAFLLLDFKKFEQYCTFIFF